MNGNVKFMDARTTPLSSAVKTLSVEQKGLAALQSALTGDLAEPFGRTVDLIQGIKGRVIISGVGKSGHIGAKMAATLASTGTPAFFVHPAEANHGDLGMITRQDAIIALSWSGETRELEGVVRYSRRFEIPLIAFTSGTDSSLAREADIVLAMPRAEEACPHGLAPTTSSMMQMALGDALAIALLELRGFTAIDFKDFHPGGQLGASLTKVGEIMHTGDRLPVVTQGTSMREAIMRISEKGFGCVGIVEEDGTLCGIITDGDLRRHIDDDILSMTVEEVMTPNPKTIGKDMLVASALTIVNTSSITALMVIDQKKPVGIVHLHDLLRVGAA